MLHRRDRRENTALKKGDKPIRNPFVVLREEFDDWAVLFNPDAAVGFGGFGLNPIAVYVWKFLDGEHALDELLDEICRLHEGVPEEARDHVGAFVEALVREGLAAHGDSAFYGEKFSHAPVAALNEAKPFTYEPPRLINLSSGQSALGVCASHGSAGGDCYSGTGATGCCSSGGCGTPYSSPCCSGTCGGTDCGFGFGACNSYCHDGTSNSVNCGTGSSPTDLCLNGSFAPSKCGCGTSGGCGMGGSVC